MEPLPPVPTLGDMNLTPVLAHETRFADGAPHLDRFAGADVPALGRQALSMPCGPPAQ